MHTGRDRLGDCLQYVVALSCGCFVLGAARIHMSVAEVEARPFWLGKVRDPVFAHAGRELLEDVGDLRWDLRFEFWCWRGFGLTRGASDSPRLDCLERGSHRREALLLGFAKLRAGSVDTLEVTYRSFAGGVGSWNFDSVLAQAFIKPHQ